jgi:hypothetical protein
MKKKTFKAEVMSGHKDDAVEVPFDPSQVWEVGARPLWPGRRGYTVKGKLNGHDFERSIVPRQTRFYLLIDKNMERATGVSPGDVVKVVVAPTSQEQR